MAYVHTRAGNQRQYMTLQRCVETQSDTGEVIRTWETEDTLWGNVTPVSLTTRERLAGGGLQPEVTHIVSLRYRSGLKQKDRLSYNSRTLEILSAVNVEERNRVHELLCREIVT